MNAAPNLQAAADQWRKNYREMTSPDGSVLEAVRSMNEKTVVQTREVYDRSTDAFDATFSTFERGPSTLLAKALWRSTESSSTSPSEM